MNNIISHANYVTLKANVFWTKKKEINKKERKLRKLMFQQNPVFLIIIKSNTNLKIRENKEIEQGLV